MKNIKLKKLLNEREEEDYRAQTIKAVNKKLKEFGIKGRIDYRKHFGTGFEVFDIGNVDVTKISPLSAVFDKMTYTIKVGGSPNGRLFKIVVQVDWEHPNGSNGYKITYSYDADKKQWTP